MKTTYLICTAILISFTSIAQKLTINVDLQNLIGREGLYISNGNQLIAIPDNGIVDLPVENLPTLFYLETISKKGNIKIKKLVWIETKSIFIEGSLFSNDLIIKPLSNKQELTDKLLINIKRIEQYPELLTSKPYLVHLTNQMKFKKEEYLQKIVKNVPQETKSFWATEKIEQYLTELNHVGYNPETKEFKYLVAINKENQEQEFKQNKSKLLLIDFSSSSCVPCLEDIDDLRELNDVHGKQIDIVTIWADRTQEIWLNVARKQKEKINWTSLRDNTGAIFKEFGINVYPTYMIFDTSGVLVKTFKGSSHNLKKFIEKQL